MGRVAVIGDVGGHSAQLRAALVALGADPRSGRLPADLQVVQVGDLVHRGPDSAGVVALVDRALTDQPDQWHQLVGNHEGQYVDTPAFDWPEVLPGDVQDTLRRWWHTGRMRTAAAITESDGGQVLVTHAGLTAGLHRRLGRPPTGDEAAAALNALRHDDPGTLWRAGTMLGGGAPDHSAGPVWAEAGAELAASWVADEARGARMPFSQVHGHSSVVVFDRGEPLLCAPELRDRVRLQQADRHVAVSAAGGLLIGVDPGFGKRAHRRWAPLVFSGAAVTA
ncbi:metallophosphoesterase [Modestobacter roseus]|uniref:Calcineurin-like phosphoesterase family protein n=1 Tax=Modestobacter roseus TaxID=1181884 RepID=A0A562IPF9_9ACTN|nr:metallophosphoesterase [Modestobacter roseus]TWH72615.1 calcineurin-like phosphoesterase family protein [Modestobacter roseus]